MEVEATAPANASTTVNRGLLFQEGTSPAAVGLSPPNHCSTVDGGMIIERDVAVQLADGVHIYIDIYRPVDVLSVPVLISWSPYGKHLSGLEPYANIPDDSGGRGCGVDPAWLSPYAGFEGPDPVAWTRAGYAVISVNPRAMWWSEGDFASVWGEREARDVCDLIEWAGEQDWSNGKVGMSGVSYLATVQWWAASLQPQHLAAINPCEGQTDPYREFIFHGGIQDTNFPGFWQHNRLKFSTTKVEAMFDMATAHPLPVRRRILGKQASKFIQG